MIITKYDNPKTLFFVSGMFAGGWIWRDTYERIPSAAHCYIMDEALCRLGGSVTEISTMLIDELDKIEAPITLIGNSLGSLICLNIAACAPHKVNKVFISGSAGFGEITLPVKLTRHQPYQISQQLLNLICYDKGKISQFFIKNIADSFSKDFKNIVSLIRESHRVKAEDLLPKISCPVHAIWGRDDVITPLSSTLDYFNRYNVQLNIINQCGHSPMLEKPNELANLLNNYLK